MFLGGVSPGPSLYEIVYYAGELDRLTLLVLAAWSWVAAARIVGGAARAEQALLYVCGDSQDLELPRSTLFAV